MLRALLIIFSSLIAMPAYAHLGHVGEVAGHAHWVGLGAVIVAGALAAAIGKLKDKDAREEEQAEEAETGEEVPAEG